MTQKAEHWVRLECTPELDTPDYRKREGLETYRTHIDLSQVRNILVQETLKANKEKTENIIELSARVACGQGDILVLDDLATRSFLKYWDKYAAHLYGNRQEPKIQFPEVGLLVPPEPEAPPAPPAPKAPKVPVKPNGKAAKKGRR